MSLMKISVVRQEVRLLVALASLNNGHSSDLCACYAGVKFSSRPRSVLAKPLRPQSAAWQSSLVANLNNIALGRTPTTKVEARTIAGRSHVVMTTLVRSLIWPYNNFVLSRYTSFFSILPSLALKPMRRKLNLHSSYLSASARVSTTQLTT